MAFPTFRIVSWAPLQLLATFVRKQDAIKQRAWVGAFAKIGPGVTVGEEAIVTLGSVLLKDAEPRGIYTGNPAVKLRERTIRHAPGPATGVDRDPRSAAT